jgi:3-oxoacyl-(acyl-carrier-protein) synthase
MLSTKGYTGHTLGAAGGIEAVFTAAGLREGWIPASAGFQNRDETIPISPVDEKTMVTGNYAVSTSLAFGGNNAAIVIGRG